MNHAFLIETHDCPELLQRIVNRLNSPNHYFFIHLDAKSKVSKIETSHIRGGYLSDNQRVKVFYPGFSMIEAEISLMRAAVAHPDGMDYFHLISGHDYPCRTNEEFDAFFEGCQKGRSFMHFDTDEQHIEWESKITRRYEPYYLQEQIKHRIPRGIIERFLNFCFRRKKNIELYAGWNWFSWHRTLAEWVLNYYDTHPDYVNRFHYTKCCDEVIFHTMLFHYIKELNIDRDNALRYIDWFPNREYDTLPLVLDERDFASIRNSGAFFCRKVFSDRSKKLLDMLDEVCK